MGRIKTSFIKHVGKELFEKHPEKFGIDFEKNKPAVDEFVDVKSKKMRNIIAGYLTTLKRQETRK
ncbi:MAG TPA: 30S ribosomal protein S17e [archaeon]|nr:30S ribosomal protein S17e [archaeon]